MSNRNNQDKRIIYPVVSMTCRSPLIHVEVDSMFQPLLYQESSWCISRLEIKEPLQTSFPLELLFATPVSQSTRTSHKLNRGSFTISFEGLNDSSTSKPSRRRQPPKVTSQWCLLEDSLVPQCSNKGCNALGSSLSHKECNLKTYEWEGESGEL